MDLVPVFGPPHNSSPLSFVYNNTRSPVTIRLPPQPNHPPSCLLSTCISFTLFKKLPPESPDSIKSSQCIWFHTPSTSSFWITYSVIHTQIRTSYMYSVYEFHSLSLGPSPLSSSFINSVLYSRIQVHWCPKTLTLLCPERVLSPFPTTSFMSVLHLVYVCTYYFFTIGINIIQNKKPVTFTSFTTLSTDTTSYVSTF